MTLGEDDLDGDNLASEGTKTEKLHIMCKASKNTRECPRSLTSLLQMEVFFFLPQKQDIEKSIQRRFALSDSPSDFT